MNDLPDEKQIGAALQYLAETDAPCAKLIARVKALEFQAKAILGMEFLDAEGTVAEREAKARASTAHRAFINDYENAVAECETIRAKRKRAELTIEVWRSLNANRRQG